MGTWIAHLRIAEKLLTALPELDEAAFTFGNLAPDSGTPNETWTEFDPPKEITHFTDKGADESHIRDMEFYRDYLAEKHLVDDPTSYSFLLGYFCHLLTDTLWSLRVWRPSKQYFQEIVEAKGTLKASWDFKADWYDLDQRYVRDNPNSLFWRVYLCAPLPSTDLPYLPEKAIHQQIDYIRKFYTQTVSHPLDRAYPFLNEATMTRFVDDAASSILKLHNLLSTSYTAIPYNSAIAMLPDEERQPYPAPLGDLH